MSRIRCAAKDFKGSDGIFRSVRSNVVTKMASSATPRLNLIYEIS